MQNMVTDGRAFAPRKGDAPGASPLGTSELDPGGSYPDPA